MGTPIVKILVASHKEYRMPDDSIYLPLHVGAEGKVDADGQPLDLGWTKDNTGDNISRLNPGFCELTGLYWAWKNLKADYIGLVHYRRHFCLKKKSRDPFENIITGAELRPILGQYWVFVPKKRRYFIETLYSHYAHTHYAEHLDATREVIAANTASGCLISSLPCLKRWETQTCPFIRGGISAESARSS